MLKNNLDIVICTDNRTVSKTTITDELILAREGYNFKPQEFKNLVLQGFYKSFFPDSEKEKQAYLKSCENYYDQVVKNTELEVKPTL